MKKQVIAKNHEKSGSRHFMTAHALSWELNTLAYLPTFVMLNLLGLLTYGLVTLNRI